MGSRLDGCCWPLVCPLDAMRSLHLRGKNQHENSYTQKWRTITNLEFLIYIVKIGVI